MPTILSIAAALVALLSTIVLYRSVARSSTARAGVVLFGIGTAVWISGVLGGEILDANSQSLKLLGLYGLLSGGMLVALGNLLSRRR